MTKLLPVFLALLMLGACSKAQRNAGGGESQPARASAVPTRMAYSYAYRFSVPEAAIATAQARHVAMCDRLGLPRCRVLEMHRSTGEYGDGSLKMEVASTIAKPFAAGLAAPVEALGGALLSNDVEAEDIGRQIVDVEARLGAKEALVTRLEEALRTRAGSTADLVATEKAVADAQGELEVVRAEERQAQGHLATSPVSIDYERRASFSGRAGDAFAAVGDTISSSVVALIYFLAAALPWAAVGTILFLAIRAALRRLRRRRQDRPAA